MGSIRKIEQGTEKWVSRFIISNIVLRFESDSIGPQNPNFTLHTQVAKFDSIERIKKRIEISVSRVFFVNYSTGFAFDPLLSHKI